MSFDNKKDVIKRGNFIKIKVCIHTSFPLKKGTRVQPKRKEERKS
jgi:hypothetical protein